MELYTSFKLSPGAVWRSNSPTDLLLKLGLSHFDFPNQDTRLILRRISYDSTVCIRYDFSHMAHSICLKK